MNDPLGVHVGGEGASLAVILSMSFADCARPGRDAAAVQPRPVRCRLQCLGASVQQLYGLDGAELVAQMTLCLRRDSSVVATPLPVLSRIAAVSGQHVFRWRRACDGVSRLRLSPQTCTKDVMQGRTDRAFFCSNATGSELAAIRAKRMAQLQGGGGGMPAGMMGEHCNPLSC